jgi:hypothetical protein
MIHVAINKLAATEGVLMAHAKRLLAAIWILQLAIHHQNRVHVGVRAGALPHPAAMILNI